MLTFKKRAFTKRNYDRTNIVACQAEVKPDDSWIETDDSILAGLTQLYIANNVRYFGYL